MNTRNLTILIVEDDEVDRLDITRSLKRSGFNVDLFYADDPESGLRQVAEREYDCIFLDYNLPGGTGLEVLKEIRGSGIKTPIIVMTTHGSLSNAVDAMKCGASDYLVKTILTPQGTAQSLLHVLRLRENEKIQEQLSKELRETQNRLNAVIANSPIVLFALDREGIFTVFDGKGTELLGIHNQELLGSSIASLSETIPGVELLFQKGISGVSDKTVVCSGSNHFEISYSPIRDEEQQITGVIGIATDVTDLTLAKEIAEDTAKLKQEFIANMSHEIRTPMNGIIGLTNILLDTSLSSEQKNYLTCIKNCSRNLLVIINDVLDFSKVELGKMSFENVPFRLSEVCGQTTELFRNKAAEKSLKLLLKLDPNLPEMVSGDPTRLTQVLNNLVNNAIKFTEQGSVAIIVRGRQGDHQQQTVLFEVYDTGIGIPQQSLDKIFESFQQASCETTRKYGGTGLGLSIVKRLIELQGGKIHVTSEPGKGSCFGFELTFERCNDELTAVPETAIDEAVTIRGLRILLTEDNPVNQMIAKKLLTGWGAHVDHADNGREALSILEHSEYDIVLMDIQMPEMNGYEATEEIRKHSDNRIRETPILAMTAHATEQERERCFSCGMNDYISKPFDPEQLKSQIHEVCSKRVQKNQASNSQFGNIGTMKSISKIEGSTSRLDSSRVSARTLRTSKNQGIGRSTHPSEAEKIDLTYIRQLAGGSNDFIVEMLELFLSRTKEALETLREETIRKNWAEVRQVAHRIKPTFRYIGTGGLQEALAEIERLTDGEPGDPETVSRLLEHIDFQSRQVFIQLETELTAIR